MKKEERGQGAMETGEIAGFSVTGQLAEGRDLLFRAVTELAKPVLLKTPHQAEYSARGRYQHELVMLRHLADSDQVVHVEQLVEADGRAVLVLEDAPGVLLTSFLERARVAGLRRRGATRRERRRPRRGLAPGAAHPPTPGGTRPASGSHPGRRPRLGPRPRAGGLPHSPRR